MQYVSSACGRLRVCFDTADCLTDPREQRRLLLDDEYCAARTASLLSELRARHVGFHAAVESLHATVCGEPDAEIWPEIPIS